MKPIIENVLVKLDKESNDNGYTSIEKDREVTTGVVVSVGDGSVDWPEMFTKPGDRVKWNRNAGQLFDLNGVPHIILNERKREIIAIL